MGPADGGNVRVSTLGWTAAGGWCPDPAAVAGEAPLDPGRTLVLAFADPAVGDDDRPLQELSAAFPGGVVVGVSTAGQLTRDGVSDDDVVAVVARLSSSSVRIAWTAHAGIHDSADAGRSLGRRLASPDSPGCPAVVLVLSDGLSVNGSALVEGLRSTLPEGVPLSGGLAADGPRFARTWVYVDGEVRSNVVAAVGLYGDVEVGSGSAGVWDGFGPERRVTRSEGNVLFEIDGIPALTLYREYLGELARELPASALLFPLAIRSPDGEEHLVRTVLGVDAQEQSMTFAGDVPVGWTVRLMRTTVDRLVDGAHAAAADARLPGPPPDLALAVSCVGRRLVLGERTDEEIEATLDALGPDTPLVGFYSYGEIGPHGAACALHNQTMTLLTLREPLP